MEPWQSWAVALAGGGLAYLYYTNLNKPKVNKPRASSISTPLQAPIKTSKQRENDKGKRKQGKPNTSDQNGSDGVASTKEEPKVKKSEEQGKKRKAGKRTPSPAVTAPIVAVSNDEPEDAKEEDNKAWAEQLAGLKKGTSLAPPVRNDSRNKTKKQAAVATSPTFSSASSNGGADADDDLSPALSPSMGAGDVSDMLEPRASGPSVLRLTDSGKPQNTRQPRAQKEFQPAETKKQRQNRQKIEDRRLERESEERDRQNKLEAQRRTARVARGEPAKNGIPASKPPAVSAWAGNAVANGNDSTIVTEVANPAPLLDTFDQDAESTSSSTGAMNKSTAASSTNTNWETELPSEEDQFRIAKQASEDEAGWNTVAVAKSKKQKQTGGVDSPVMDTLMPIKPVQRPTAPKPKTGQPATNGFSSLDLESKFDAGSHPDDSSWGA